MHCTRLALIIEKLMLPTIMGLWNLICCFSNKAVVEGVTPLKNDSSNNQEMQSGFFIH